MPRNAAGCGDITIIDCFTQAGGGESSPLYSVLATVLSPVPRTFPSNVRASYLSQDSSVIVVTWQPFTLVEARGFIEYIIELREVDGQLSGNMTASMDQNNVTFSGVDPSRDYVATVGTRSLSAPDTVGPGQLLCSHILCNDVVCFM